MSTLEIEAETIHGFDPPLRLVEPLSANEDASDSSQPEYPRVAIYSRELLTIFENVVGPSGKWDVPFDRTKPASQAVGISQELYAVESDGTVHPEKVEWEAVAWEGPVADSSLPISFKVSRHIKREGTIIDRSSTFVSTSRNGHGRNNASVGFNTSRLVNDSGRHELANPLVNSPRSVRGSGELLAVFSTLPSAPRVRVRNLMSSDKEKVIIKGNH